MFKVIENGAVRETIRVSIGPPLYINIAIPATVFELFDVELYHDLEIWVKGHLGLFKLVPFESLGVVSYCFP